MYSSYEERGFKIFNVFFYRVLRNAGILGEFSKGKLTGSVESQRGEQLIKFLNVPDSIEAW